MRKLIVSLLLLAAGSAIAQVPPPPAATQAEVNAGLSKAKYVSPLTLAGYATLTATGGVTAAVATNIARAISSTNNTTGNAATATMATNAITIQNSAIVNPFMFGAKGDGGKEGIGTDDSAAFIAAIAAKSNTSWIIDGLNRDYKINANILQASNNVTIRNCRFYTTNASIAIFTNMAHFCFYENDFFWGPGTNANGRQPLPGSAAIATSTRPWEGSEETWLTISKCRAEGFDIGYSLSYLDSTKIVQAEALGNKSYGFKFNWVDHTTIEQSYGGMNNTALGAALPNEWYTTNAAMAWISNCVGVRADNFNNMVFLNSSAAYCKRGYEFADGQNLTMINYNSEDFYDASSGIRTVGYSTNVRSMTIINALGQKIDPNSSTNLFKWVLVDCPSDIVHLDLGARYEGTTPQLAIFFTPSFISGAPTRFLTTPKLEGNVYVRWLTNLSSFYGDVNRPDVNYDSGTVPNLAYINNFQNTNLFGQIIINAAPKSLAAGNQVLQFVSGNGDEGIAWGIGGPGPSGALVGLTSAFDFGFARISSGSLIGYPFWVAGATGNAYFQGPVFSTNGFTTLGTSAFTGNGSGLSNAVTLIAGSGMTITTNADKRTFTLASSGGSSFWVADPGPDGGYTNLVTARWTSPGAPILTLTNNYVYLSAATPSMLAHSVYFDTAQNYFIIGNDSPGLYTGIAGDANLNHLYSQSNYVAGGMTVAGAINASTINTPTMNATNAFFFHSEYSVNQLATNGLAGGATNYALDFSTTNMQTILATGNVYVASLANVAAGRWKVLNITNVFNTSSNITLYVQTNLAWLGPTNYYAIGASPMQTNRAYPITNSIRLSLTPWGTTASSIDASAVPNSP